MTRDYGSGWLAVLLLSALPMAAPAADTDGLDLTVQVLGKNERVDDRIVNRIAVPGVPLDARATDPGARSGPEAVLPAPLQPIEPPLGAVQDLTRQALDLLRPRPDPAK